MSLIRRTKKFIPLGRAFVFWLRQLPWPFSSYRPRLFGSRFLVVSKPRPKLKTVHYLKKKMAGFRHLKTLGLLLKDSHLTPPKHDL